MSSETDESQGLVLGLVFGVIALVLALVIGVVVHHTGQQRAAKVQAAAAAVAPAISSAAADGASLKFENGVATFYFATGKADLAPGASDALSAVVHGTPEGKKILVSGFHDATGDAAQNAELAKLRAFAVRDALVSLGVAAERIELKKPEETLASGPNDQARRVEVRSE